MKLIQRNITRIDNFQRRHRPLAFGYAVVKKYGEDEAGYQAALLTYYSFLSLFPLLLVLATLTSSIASSHPGLQKTIIDSASTYFPVLGSQLAEHVHSLHKNGLALLIGIIFILYGTRGVADAFRHGVQTIWGIPKAQRTGFPQSTLSSLAIIIVGGLGFMLASISAGIAGSSGHLAILRIVALVANLLILFLLFTFLLNASLPRHVTIRETRVGAVTAVIGLVILQSLGGYVLTRELKNLDALYSYFALSLGLLFWIYLQAQMLFYAVEIAVVSAKKHWPRSLSGQDPHLLIKK